MNERGKTILHVPGEDLVLVFGMKDDSISVLHMDRSGRLLQVRTFIIVPGVGNHLSGACMDPDGMVGLAGHAGTLLQGGRIFACRYDPATGEVIWARDFVSYTDRDYSFTIVLNPVTGQYVLSNNVLVPNVNNDLELIELDRTTGAMGAGMTGYYHRGGNDHIGKMLFHEGYAYGVGRFSYSADQDEMRNTVIKLDPTDGGVEWLRMGHVGESDAARLYGVDLDIRDDTLYTMYYGDPSGSSTSTTYVFVQRSTLDGTVQWVEQYDLPGSADIGYEMIPAGEGYVILAHSRLNGGTLFLFRIDPAGEVIWARNYLFPGLSVSASVDRGTSRLAMIGDSLWVTGTSISPAGDADMILLRTDLEGQPHNACVNSTHVSLDGVSISNPVFVDEVPIRYDSAIIVSPHVVDVYPSPPGLHPACFVYNPMVHSMSIEICQGETFEGYSAGGMYRDTFITSSGCDSIRTLDLTVTPTVFQYIEASICAGSLYEGYSISGTYQDTFVASSGCDSVRVLTLVVTPPAFHSVTAHICTGDQFEGYSVSGTYQDTFSTTLGCDSIRMLTLVAEDVVWQEIVTAVCAGETYEGYASGGVYLDTFVAMAGCDSIRRLVLTVMPSIEADVGIALCEGGTYAGYVSSGFYVDTLQSVAGCDSIRRLSLSVAPAPETHLLLDICDAADSGYATPGFYRDTLRGADGCDTLRLIEVSGIMAAVPNVFSPNQDGVNDYLMVDPGDGSPPLRYARLFDRWGGHVFEQTSWPVTWDGRDSRGGYHPSGVYTLVLRYDCGGAQVVEKGTITLLR